MGCHRIGLGMNSVVKEAIEMFEYQIPNSIKEDIAQFLKEKEYELRKEANVTADQAVYICDHWEKKHSDVYSMLIEKLLFDEPNK